MTEEIIIENAFHLCQRLEQENKDFEILAKSLYKRIEELEKENEALAFRERLYKADYEASEQENKELKKEIESQKGLITVGGKQQNETTMAYDKCKSALEEIREINKLCFERKCGYPEDLIEIDNIINEVLK